LTQPTTDPQKKLQTLLSQGGPAALEAALAPAPALEADTYKSATAASAARQLLTVRC